MQKWNILKKTDISPSKWFPLEQHTIVLPNGTQIDDFYISPMDNSVTIVPITKSGDIVLIREYKHAVGEILTMIPAGMVQPNKSFEESALAELEEEVGIRTTVDNLISLGVSACCPTKLSQMNYAFLAKDLDLNASQKLEITEHIEVFTTSPKIALDMAISGEICDSDSVIAIMRAAYIYPELFE
jgi:8-oxo-dGTP pyrophosphatase MutT (NUDIX family)